MQFFRFTAVKTSICWWMSVEDNIKTMFFAVYPSLFKYITQYYIGTEFSTY